jgi:YD repeat-containing protein
MIDRSLDGPDMVKTYQYERQTNYSMPTYFYDVRDRSAVYRNGSWANIFSGTPAFQHWASYDLAPMSTAQGNHVGYGRVIVSQEGQGSSVYEYEAYRTALPDLGGVYATHFQTGTYNASGYNYPPMPPIHQFSRGNLKAEIHFDPDFRELSRVEYDYETFSYAVPELPATRITRLARVIDGQAIEGLAYTRYPIYAGLSRLVRKTERNFSQTGNEALTTITEYKYESNDHLMATEVRTSNSQGGWLVNRIKYPSDYTNLPPVGINCPNDVATNPDSRALCAAVAIREMRQRNIIAPIESYTLRQHADGSSRVIGGSLTTQRINPLNQLPVPDRAWAIETAAPINNFTPSTVSATNRFQFHSSYREQGQYQVYDQDNNLQQAQANNLPVQSRIYSQDRNYLLAEATNAQANQIAHTSFEEDPLAKADAPAKTGVRYRELKASDGSFPVPGTDGLPAMDGTTTITYTLSYWWRASTTQPSWQLFETQVTKAANSPIIISGRAGQHLDEVRVYPAGALMTTYTYRPLAGMTSQMDANHVATYYEYDGLGRLQYVRDQDGNLLKTYEYNYKQ